MEYKILLVDDEPEIINIVTDLLKDNFPCEIVIANNGIDAFYISIEKVFDLIITDFRMSESSGSEFINELREGRWASYQTPVIFFTGYVDDAKSALSSSDNIFFVDKTKCNDELVSTTKTILNYFSLRSA
ncbi:MAG: response regulator [Oligoflexia bacterium]|nr:response regulator [Oligoflexia bacterium]